MKSRVLTSVAIFLCLIPLVIFSGYLVYPVALSAMAVIAVFEVLRVMGVHKKLAVSIPAYIFTAAFPVLAYRRSARHKKHAAAR